MGSPRSNATMSAPSRARVRAATRPWPVLKRLAEEIISIEGYSVAGTGGPEKSGAEKASGSENSSALGSAKKAGEK